MQLKLATTSKKEQPKTEKARILLKFPYLAKPGLVFLQVEARNVGCRLGRIGLGEPFLSTKAVLGVLKTSDTGTPIQELILRGEPLSLPLVYNRIR